MKKIFLFSLLHFAFCITAICQQNISAYPTHWWVNMKNPKLQIMLHGEKIADKFPMIKMSPAGIKLAQGVKLMMISRVENPNYIFLDMVIDATAKPGKISFPFVRDANIEYELKPRRTGKGIAYAQGITSRDLMYLIMPDRFSNGDTTNDRIAGMRDQSLRRDTVFNRHGGDLLGIQNHLDYLQSLSITALWLNPVLENDMPDRTEHGYAFTDHYKIDPRIGGETAYQNLIDAAHNKGMKIIQDAVYNHVGKFHFTVTDLPMNDWLHQWPKYTNTTYKDQVLFDPYASAAERKIMSDGWFTRSMPDINQNNPFVANFLIQHAIYTVEEFGIDGWRIDTYAYNDLDFMNRCNKALNDEYPQLTMFGETWVHGVPNQSYFVQNNYNIPYKSNLHGATDFQLLWAMNDVMTKDFGWDDGVNKLYTTLAQDFVYKDANRNVIFLDNHDINRYFSVIGEDVSKYKSALAWLLTCRGIPQLYYGDELGMTGFTSPNDGYVRLDFQGGWANDSLNKFSIAGRTAREESIWRYIAKLANFRKNSTAITSGKMMQFVPEDAVYVYFRYDNKQTVMTVMNTAKETKTIKLDRFTERTAGFTKMKNIETGEVTPLQNFTLEKNTAGVYELIR